MRNASCFDAENLFFEAGSNSFEVCKRLGNLGLRACVLESSHMGKHAKTYADNDKMAAARIALVYLAGTAPCVWVPYELSRERSSSSTPTAKPSASTPQPPTPSKPTSFPIFKPILMIRAEMGLQFSEIPFNKGSVRQLGKISVRHTISIKVENKFGVLTRVAGMFSGRGFNIDTLNVGPTHEPNTSRMTVVAQGDEATLDQIIKQLNKLVDVIEVDDFKDGESVNRELILVKVTVTATTRAEVMQICDIFRGKIVDVQPTTLTVELTGDESKVEKFLQLMAQFGIAELSRTGRIAVKRS
jgi:acetolactate synthase-1/3 small subunit